MRFTRADLPGILIAVLAGPLLMLLFLAAFEAWGHRGTPLLGGMGSNLGIAAGLAAVFSRFILKWDWPLAFVGVILISIASVYWAQQSGNDGTRIATALKWIGVLGFVGLNVAVVWQILINGIWPIFERFEARRAGD